MCRYAGSSAGLGGMRSFAGSGRIRPVQPAPSALMSTGAGKEVSRKAHLHEIITEHQETVQSANSQLWKGKLVIDAEIMLISGFLLDQVPGALLAAIAFWGRYQPIQHIFASWGPDPRSMIKTDSLIGPIAQSP